jgi:peptidyl-prolyl cis-trans isomerase C
MSRSTRLFRSLIAALTLLLPIAASVHAQDAEADAEKARRALVVAKISEVTITLGDVEDYIAKQAPMLRVRYKDPAELKKLLDNMVRFELLAAEAVKRGYDKQPSVVRTIKETTVQNLMRTEIDEKVTPRSIPAEDVKAFYDSHPEEFHRDAMRRASHILVATEQEAKQLLSEVQKLDLRGFSDLAKARSLDTDTKLRGGDLGYFTLSTTGESNAARVDEALRKAAFGLKQVGDTVRKPIKVEGGFSVVRLTGERPERHTTLLDADPSIRTRLWRERRQNAMKALVDGLRAKEKPKTFPERVDLVKLEDMDKGPSGFATTPDDKAEAAKKSAEEGEKPEEGRQ